MAMYFYDNQIRRYLLQFVRMFSGYNVEWRSSENGQVVRTLRQVPVVWGDSSRNVAAIIRQNSANAMPSVPMISLYVSNLTYARNRIMEPNHISKMQLRTRKKDESTGEYIPGEFNTIQVDRHMPVPYDLDVTVDIWTSSTEEKLQLLEQILCLFNPALELQSTDNYIDWTSLSYVELTDVNWSSRSVPQGTEAEIDVATLRFKAPIWISMPAKVKKSGVIHKVVASIWQETGELSDEISRDALLMGERNVYTPMDYGVLLIGGQLKLLPYTHTQTQGLVVPDTDYDLSWPALLAQYGTVENGITQIMLEQEDGSEIVGTIAFHPGDDSVLLYTVDDDTVPANTLAYIDAVIDPRKSGPLDGYATGTRYLVLDNIGGQGASPAWGLLHARANDIIEYDGAMWSVVFDSANTTDIEYCTNLKTSVQYKWTGAEWVKSYEGEYKNSNWRIVI